MDEDDTLDVVAGKVLLLLVEPCDMPTRAYAPTDATMTITMTIATPMVLANPESLLPNFTKSVGLKHVFIFSEE